MDKDRQYLIKYGNGNKRKSRGISFDDGPNPRNIEEVLAILSKEDCQATFFWITQSAKNFAAENSSLFQRVIDQIKNAGHEIGLHAPYDYQPTFVSRSLSKFTKEELRESLKELEELTDVKVRFYRPHYMLQPISILFARQLGLTVVFGDLIHYTEPNAPVKAQINKFSGARAGSILIFHDGVTLQRKETHVLRVLPQVLSNLRNSNLNPTKVSNII